MSKERLRAAKNLIKQGRYDHAADILRELDDPAAQVWLEKLAMMKPRRKRQATFHLSDYRPLLPFVALAMVVATIMGIMVVFSTLLSEQGETAADRQNQDVIAEGWDEVYMTLANYCFPLIGYGAETCMDWTDLILGSPFDVNRSNFASVQNCLPPDSIETPEAYSAFGACLAAAGLPPPPGY